MFANKLESYADRLALVDENGQTLSYTQLAQRADEIFADSQISPRTLIGVECANVVESVCAYLGSLRRGQPVLLIDGQLDVQLRSRLYKHFHVSCVYETSGQWVWIDTTVPDVHPDVAVLLSTSGSTGSPKLVKLSAGNLDSNAYSIVQYLGLGQEERPITSLPIHYSYGLSVLNSHLAVGATILLTGQPVTARKFWDMFREHKASSMSGVPTTYSMLRQMRFERMDLPSLRTLTQAGGKMTPEMVHWFGELAQSRGQRFFVMYGQTEATARMSYVPPHRLLEKTSSIGVPIPLGSLDLVDNEGHVLQAQGEIGELRYSGPNVMLGYANNVQDLALPDEQNGVLLTGDLAWCDDDGFFHVVGRLKRFIKVFGNRIALDEIEAQLREMGYDVAVTGRDDLLVVALRDGSDQARDNLAAQICERYRLHRSGVHVGLIKSFPLSSSGKIQYTDLLGSLCP